MAGDKITLGADGSLNVPDRPIIPFIEGDGTGPDIWRAAVRVFDAAVARAYGGRRKLVWREVLAGEKAFRQTGNWLPDETVAAFREYRVGIKGPLTTPDRRQRRRSCGEIAIRGLLVSAARRRWLRRVSPPI